MGQYTEEIWALITRKLSGELNPDEEYKLEEWLNEDPKHREFYNSIESSWNQNPGESVDSFYLSFQFDHESGLKKLRSKLREDSNFSRNRKNRILQNKSSRSYTWKMVAVLLVLVLSSIAYLTFQSPDQPTTDSYTTSENEQRIITFSDGSVVRLNRDSMLEVTKNSFDESRMIRLEGEAFFDVSHNPERTFVIHAGDGVVEVLGTSFNVKESGEVMVAVQEGLVSFRHVGHAERSSAQLGPGQLGLLPDDGSVIVEQTPVENYMSWMNGYLRFNNMSFENVLRQLGRIYGIEFELEDSSLEQLRLTIYTERLQIEEILETIAEALDMEFEKQDNTIKWKQNRN